MKNETNTIGYETISEQIARIVPVVADSVADIRPMDLDRLADTCEGAGIEIDDLAAFIANHPDSTDRVKAEAADLFA